MGVRTAAVHGVNGALCRFLCHKVDKRALVPVAHKQALCIGGPPTRQSSMHTIRYISLSLCMHVR
jgi:hypothetical protein